MNKISKAYFILLILAIVTFFVSLILENKELHVTAFDSHYIVSQNFILKIFGVKLLLLSTFYRLFSRLLYSKWLTLLHIMLSVLMFIFLLWYNEQMVKSLALIELSNNSTEFFADFNRRFQYAIIVYVSIQILPLINIIAGLMKRNIIKRK